MRDFVPDDFIPEPDAVQGVPDGQAPAERIPDELVDAFFDGELEEDESRAFIRELRNDAPTAKKVVSLNSALEALRRPVSTPDFTASVLDEVDGRSPLLSGREFKLLAHWRAAAAVLMLGLITAAFTTQRLAPGATFTAQDAPVTRLSQTIPTAAMERPNGSSICKSPPRREPRMNQAPPVPSASPRTFRVVSPSPRIGRAKIAVTSGIRLAINATMLEDVVLKAMKASPR